MKRPARFKPMLSATLKDHTTLEYPLLASPKIDGIRAFTPNPELKIFDTSSRKLIGIPNTHTRFLTREFPYLDGELVVGPPNHPETFQRTRKNGVMTREGHPDITLWVFDRTDMPDATFSDRYLSLIPMSRSFPPFIKLLHHTWIENPRQLADYEEWCLYNGYEGVMTRHRSGPYKWGRSTLNEEYLTKWKRFEYEEAEVIGYAELEKNMNELTVDELGHAKRSSAKDGKLPMGVLGALYARAPGWGEFSIGSGSIFTKDMRAELWPVRESLLGRPFRFKFQLTGSLDAPRIPIFSCWL